MCDKTLKKHAFFSFKKFLKIDYQLVTNQAMF
jgi:hypothetical protein